MCSAGFTVGMRNWKRNERNGRNEPNEVPKLNVFERNGRNDQNESSKTSNTTYHNGWNKQKVESWGNIIFVFTSGTSKKDIFDNLVFARGGWHLRFANDSGPGVSTATNDGNWN